MNGGNWFSDPHPCKAWWECLGSQTSVIHLQIYNYPGFLPTIIHDGFIHTVWRAIIISSGSAVTWTELLID